MIRRYLLAAIFAACTICAPIFTEAIASPIDHKAMLIHDNTALPAAPADTLTATPVRFCAVVNRSSIVADNVTRSATTITSDRYHIRC